MSDEQLFGIIGAGINEGTDGLTTLQASAHQALAELQSCLSVVEEERDEAERDLLVREDECDRLRDENEVLIEQFDASVQGYQSRLATAEEENKRLKDRIVALTGPEGELNDMLDERAVLQARLAAAEEWKPMYEAQQRQLGRAEAVVEAAKRAQELGLGGPRLWNAVRRYEEGR